jgi:polar amino acid transport system substrate-binding protein
VFIGRSDVPFEGKQSLRDKVLAVQDGTTAQATAKRLQQDVGFKEIRPYRSTPEPFEKVRSGKAHFALDHRQIAMQQCKDPDLRMLSVPGIDLSAEPLGIALRLEAVALRKALEDALQAMKEDGTYDQIRSKWIKP